MHSKDNSQVFCFVNNINKYNPAKLGTSAVIDLVLKDVNLYRFVNILAADCEIFIKTPLFSLFTLHLKPKHLLKVEHSLLESNLVSFGNSCAECWMESCLKDGDFVNAFFSLELLIATF